jgi:hypothetical protein
MKTYLAITGSSRALREVTSYLSDPGFPGIAISPEANADVVLNADWFLRMCEQDRLVLLRKFEFPGRRLGLFCREFRVEL